MLRLDCEACVPGGAVNEDVVGHTADAAWVIDGATGVGAALLEEPSDAAWLARRADRAIRSLLASDPGIRTGQLIREVCVACRDDLGRLSSRRANGTHEHPSAAIAIVRSRPHGLELATLGDCRIAYRDQHGQARLFGETGLAAFEAKTVALVRRLLRAEPALGPNELRERLRPQLLENRRSMNVEGGYWVLGTNPAAADHLDAMVVPTAIGSPFAIGSDGFLRLVELFGLASPGDLLAIADQGALGVWMDRLRHIERGEGSWAMHPRVKLHDDASFLRGAFEEEL